MWICSCLMLSRRSVFSTLYNLDNVEGKIDVIIRIADCPPYTREPQSSSDGCGSLSFRGNRIR